MNPTLSAEAVARFVPQIQAVTNAFIDRFVESGECDLVLDLCSPVPAMVTLQYLGLPTDEWERYAVPIHSSVYTPREPGHPAFEHLNQQFAWIFDQVRAEIADRHLSPREDDLITSRIGAGLDDGLVFETVYTMLAAGVDTSTSVLSAALLHLSQYPGQKQTLIDKPELLDLATEEFLRVYAPAQATARTAIADIEVAGIRFRPATASCCRGPPPTGTPVTSTSRTRSWSTGPRTVTSPLPMASTAASEPPWPARSSR